jgi:exodeoxyribonuclease I
MTYLFYDIETTGLNPAFDQVLQFAAIRTDADLNEIERYEYRVKLREDVVPAPMAVLTHGITPDQMQQGESEYDVIQKIHDLMNTPGTISLGYNTLGFDDEFLRFSFYRNLLTPYTHQFANRCGRMDIFPVTTLFYLFGKTDLDWPQKNGHVSLKLENICKQNKLAEGPAHDAMVDVIATLELAKRLKKQTAMWDYATAYFNKAEDAKRFEALTPSFDFTDDFRDAVYVNSKLGYKNHCLAPMITLGQHKHYKNQMLLLRLDGEDLQKASVSEPDKHAWVMRKKLGEPGLLLPARERYFKHFPEARMQLAHENKQWLHDHPEVLQAIADYYCDYQYPIVPNADLDSVLYQTGFLSDQDQRCCQRFHKASVAEKLKMIPEFSTTELQGLAIRLIGRNFPGHLTGDYQAEYKTYLNKNDHIDFRENKKLSKAAALSELKSISLEKHPEGESLAKSLQSLYAESV